MCGTGGMCRVWHVSCIIACVTCGEQVRLEFVNNHVLNMTCNDVKSPPVCELNAIELVEETRTLTDGSVRSPSLEAALRLITGTRVFYG